MKPVPAHAVRNDRRIGQKHSRAGLDLGRPYDEVVGKVQKCAGLEHIAAAQERGKGIIFLTRIWAVSRSPLFAAQRVPITVLYRPPKLRWLESVMCAGRERGQAKLAKADVSGVRLLYKALKRGEAIGLLPTRYLARARRVVDFFARPPTPCRWRHVWPKAAARRC